jgi:hypothetical protein
MRSVLVAYALNLTPVTAAGRERLILLPLRPQISWLIDPINGVWFRTRDRASASWCERRFLVGRDSCGDELIIARGVVRTCAYAELEIMKQMLKDSKETYFAIFTFASSSGIDDTMLALARGGMAICGVVDRGQAAQR